MLRGLAALAALAAAGCVNTPAEIVVRITSDLDPPDELRTVRLVVLRQGEGSPSHNVSYELRAPLHRLLPGEVGLVARDESDARPLSVRVTGTVASGGALVQISREYVVRFAADQRLLLDVTLARACLPGAPPGLICPAGSECGRDGCEPVEVASLPTLETDVVDLRSGGAFTCARRATGALMCWGRNDHGQLGDGTVLDRATPGGVTGLSDVHLLALGSSHACARLATGVVACWGGGGAGQLGRGASADGRLAVSIDGLTSALGVAAGAGHSCARTSGGGVVCWGSNDRGQLGDGTTTPRPTPGPVALDSPQSVVEIAAGDEHTCALGRDGRIQCWGRNDRGQLGDGTTTPRATPVYVAGISGAIELVAGARHSCARRADGSVSCWGDNANGQLGAAAPSASATASAVPGLAANGLSAGGAHTCARRPGGSVVCWGRNDRGQLGDGGGNDRATPAPVDGVSGVVQIAAGGAHTCARLATGSVRCWGANEAGQLGNGARADAARPSAVAGL